MMAVPKYVAINNVYKTTCYSILRQRNGAWFGTRIEKGSAVATSSLFALVTDAQGQLQLVYLSASFGDLSPFILAIRFLQRSWNPLYFHSKTYVLFTSYIQPRRTPKMVIPTRLLLGTRPSCRVLL